MHYILLEDITKNIHFSTSPEPVNQWLQAQGLLDRQVLTMAGKWRANASQRSDGRQGRLSGKGRLPENM